MSEIKTVIVTGGAGFIGSAVIRHLIADTDVTVINLDKLTYAANLASLNEVSGSDRYKFEQADICDAPALEAARNYWTVAPEDVKKRFRFHHISTDEVFGSLGDDGLFTEETAYDPRSPYSASKASSDHLVRAWMETYGLPTVLSNCSNNYGPYHFPEKLIPLMIIKGLAGEPLPVYGKGENVRDWLFVDDHARALWTVCSKGVPGESYNIGGNEERRNIDVVTGICDLLDELVPQQGGKKYSEQITHVTDRPGHDFRYAIDASKIKAELGWEPSESFESGMRKTVEWYLDRKDWWQPILDGKYAGERLGTGSRE